MQRFLLFLFLALTVAACNTDAPDTVADPPPPVITDSAQWVIEQAIQRHGGDLLDTTAVEFVFREKKYVARRKGNQFTYLREYVDQEGRKIDDMLSNDNFTRKVDGQIGKLSEKDSSAYASSLNSVMYFAFLPYFLNDAAVKAEYQGITESFGPPHHELLVTFGEEDGGEDFEDEYAYWFAADNFRLNYLAYNFLVNGGGARFREAYNVREVEGILFQDYLNYKPTDAARRDVLNFDDLFKAGALDTLSRIELEEIGVKY
jgi:hypothetical protein